MNFLSDSYNNFASARGALADVSESRFFFISDTARFPVARGRVVVWSCGRDICRPTDCAAFAGGRQLRDGALPHDHWSGRKPNCFIH